MKFRCDADIYCPTPDLFDSVTEFTDMCLFVFGAAPVLRRVAGGHWFDENNVLVLVEVEDPES